MYASQPPSPTPTQHSLPGDALPSYPGRTSTGWNTPASPGAQEEAARTGKPARRFRAFRWSTLDSWSRRRRVIGKAECTRGAPNPRLVVTSPKRGAIDARVLHERTYCARGDMEDRAKECQLDLFAGRASAATMRANQLRL